MYQKPKIGQIELDGWAVLAPMAGVSDLAYRVIARRMGAAMTTAEMVSAKGLYYKNEKTRDMLKIDPGEHPVALQLFGSEPDIMALGAKEMEKAGADIIDINMGCPMQKVVKNGDGSALMKNIPLAAEVVKAMAEAVHIPVTVKMRLGWSRENWRKQWRRQGPWRLPSMDGPGKISTPAMRTGKKSAKWSGLFTFLSLGMATWWMGPVRIG